MLSMLSIKDDNNVLVEAVIKNDIWHKFHDITVKLDLSK